MKKSLLFILISSLLFSSCKNRPNTIIHGVFQNSGKQLIKLEYLNVDKTVVLDSMKLKKDGSFRFKIHVEQPGLYILKDGTGKIISLMISPAEQIKVEADFKDFDKKYSVSGSPESENIRKLVEKLNETRAKIKELEDPYRNVEFTPDQADSFLIARNKLINDQRNFSIQFIIEHLNSLSSIYALYQKISPDELVLGDNRDIQFMKIVSDSLSVRYPNSGFVKTFVDDARTAERRYKNLIGIQKKINEASYGLPEIVYPDSSGIQRSLSSLKGKTVLVYFWSAYSDISKVQIPQLEKIYKKYKNRGFEIYSVCVEANPELWRRVIVYESLSFLNLYGPQFITSDAAVAYNVRKIPSNFLVDKKGEVIARNVFGEELERWLDNKL